MRYKNKFLPLNSNRRGITFLEIMFASIILAVALLPIIQSSSQNIRRTGFNIHRSMATSLISQLMERYKSMPYSWLTKQFEAGTIDMSDLLQNDPVLASPFVPASYKERIADVYEVTGSFEDIQGNEAIGLLSFKVKWKSNAKVKATSISLAKTVINYAKFGVQTSGTQGAFLQEGGSAPSKLNSGSGTDYLSSSGGDSINLTDPFQAIQSYGSPGC
jgi:hypothetical protein